MSEKRRRVKEERGGESGKKRERERGREAATWIICVESHDEPGVQHGAHGVLSAEEAAHDLQTVIAAREREESSERAIDRSIE